MIKKGKYKMKLKNLHKNGKEKGNKKEIEEKKE